MYFNSGNNNDEYIYDRERNLSFKFHDIPMNWTSAIETCRQEGARLFVTDSAEKNDLVYNLKGVCPRYCTSFILKSWPDFKVTR